MVRKLRPFSFLLLFSIRLMSQNWVWDTLVPSDYQLSLAKDGYHHIYCYRVPNSNQNTPMQTDTILCKYSDNGHLLWKKYMPSTIELIKAVCSPDSSIYLLGTFPNTLSISSFTATTKGDYDICLLKFDGSGNLLWLRQIGSRYHDYATDICMNGTDIVVT